MQVAETSPETRRREAHGLSPRQLLAEGVHPVTLLPLLPENPQLRCGGCARAYVRRVGERTFIKCAEAPGRRHGRDVPADLPACSAFTARGQAASPYAALAADVPTAHRPPAREV